MHITQNSSEQKIFPSIKASSKPFSKGDGLKNI